MFCVLLYARVSLSIYSLALDFFLELGIAGDSACLVIYPFSFSCSISALVLINCYVIEISIVYVFQTDIMYYVLRVCYSSFMNYYGILISAASYSDISVSVILWLYFICSKFIYNAVFEKFKSDMCGCEWLKISSCYSWYQSFGFRQTLACGAKTHYR